MDLDALIDFVEKCKKKNIPPHELKAYVEALVTPTNQSEEAQHFVHVGGDVLPFEQSEEGMWDKIGF